MRRWFYLTWFLAGLASFATATTPLPESVSADTRRFAVVFDFDTDSCYPSPAIDPSLGVNPGLGVTGIDTSYVQGCRERSQLDNSNTYHRRAVIQKSGSTFEVRMYALYFMKDKDLPLNQVEGVGGHRHDWEFALVWIKDGALTHASYSAHGKVTTKARNELYFDGWCPDCVKIVYHKDGGSTHSMRFASKDERPENQLNRWFTPAIVEWSTLSPDIRAKLNAHDFGHANCSVCDRNFSLEIKKSPPASYPGASEWEAAAKRRFPVAPGGADVRK